MNSCRKRKIRSSSLVLLSILLLLEIELGKQSLTSADRRAASGLEQGAGVWKTTDAGTSWNNISDGYFQVGSIGAIAVAPSDENVVYVGTGSAEPRGNVSIGNGVYKSTNSFFNLCFDQLIKPSSSKFIHEIGYLRLTRGKSECKIQIHSNIGIVFSWNCLNLKL